MKKLLFGIILLAGLIVFPIMSMAQLNLRVSVPVPLPPPIPFVGPPKVVILPGTDIYAVPDVNEELFFRQGWWWRHHGGLWYRSQYYDRGWGYYRGYPSWYSRIPHDWRDNYRNHTWGGRPWNHSYIRHADLNNHWRGHPDVAKGGRHNVQSVAKGGSGHNVQGGEKGGHHR
jgi:hypothetical protein